MNHGRPFAFLALLAWTLPASLPASAMTLSYSTVWDGSSNLTGGPGTITTSFNPIHDGFSHTFAAPTPCCVVNGSYATGYGFLDDYVFDVPAGTVTASISSLDLSASVIQNLQARLYSIDAGGTMNTVPTIGNPNGTVLRAIMQGAEEGSGLMIYGSALAPGRYSLQISGNVMGRSGGSYSGSIGFSAAPTPLPGALPLLLSGAGLLMVLRRAPQARCHRD
jgi:hypothetical protein